MADPTTRPDPQPLSEEKPGSEPVSLAESLALMEYLHGVFLADQWLVQYPNLLHYLRIDMPPERMTELEFNENYETDRKRVTRYASCIEDARGRLCEVLECLGEREPFLEKLRFDPWADLGGRSPLDEYRDKVLRGYFGFLDSTRLEDARAIREVIERWERGAYRGRSGDAEHQRFCREFQDVLDRVLQSSPGIEQAHTRLRAVLEQAAANGTWVDLSRHAETISSLDAIMQGASVSPHDTHLARLLALESASSTWNPDVEKQGWLRRRLGSAQPVPKPRVRDAFLDVYCALLVSWRRSVSLASKPRTDFVESPGDREVDHA
jgi:hypothetical protein